MSHLSRYRVMDYPEDVYLWAMQKDAARRFEGYENPPANGRGIGVHGMVRT